MTKIAYNKCFGGFGLSEAAIEAILDRKGIEWEKNKGRFGLTAYWRKGHVGEADAFLSEYHFDERRTDPDLITMIEELGAAANGDFADLAIRDLPPGTKYRINEYDGAESVITLDEHKWRTA